MIGRAEGCGLVLPHARVSARHATIRALEGGHELLDTSHAGSFVDGRKVIGRKRLRRGAVIDLGPYRLVYTGEGLQTSLRQGGQVEASRVSCRGGRRTLLSSVTFSARPGELIAVLGSSGSGKSTLLRALAGVHPLEHGEVRLGGRVATGEVLADVVGFVPQDDVLHLGLTPRETLTYAADLRLLPDLGRVERDARVERLLAELGLRSAADRPVAQLSGGQRKRVSLGLELLDEPGVLLLDEPTAGLDPSLHRRLLETFRGLADEGRTVMLSTHRLESLELCDRLLVLNAGHVAFCGTPAQALERFGIAELHQLYDRLPSTSRPSGELVGARPKRLVAIARSLGWRAAARRTARQTSVVSRRALRLLLRDRRRSAILLAQAPVLGLVLALALEGPSLLLFLLVLTAIWCGTSAASREIVKERAVLARELRAGLGRAPYLAAKVGLLAGVNALQVALLLGVVASLRALPGELLPLYGALLLSALVSSLIGLSLSSLARSPDQANALVPLILIPQVLLAGALASPSDLSRSVGRATPARWAYDLALRVTADGSVRSEAEHQRQSELLAVQQRVLAEEAVSLIASPSVPSQRDSQAQRVFKSLRQDALTLREVSSQLDTELERLSRARDRANKHVAEATQKLEFIRGPARPPHARPRTDQQRLENATYRTKRWAAQIGAGHALVEDLETLRKDAELLNKRSKKPEARIARLRELHAGFLEREHDLRKAVAADQRQWRVAVSKVEGTREQARELRAAFVRLEQTRAELRAQLRDGRVARFEPYGSLRGDALALGVFGAIALLVAGLGLGGSIRQL